jgi:hypothetical protein
METVRELVKTSLIYNGDILFFVSYRKESQQVTTKTSLIGFGTSIQHLPKMGLHTGQNTSTQPLE